MTSVQDPHHRPWICLTLTTNLYLGRKEKAEEIVNLLRKHDDIFLPQRFDTERERKDHPRYLPFEENLQLAIRELSEGDPPLLVADRKRPVKTSLNMAFTRSQMFDFISFGVESEKWFADDPTRLERFLVFAKDLYSVVEASSGFIENGRFERRFDRVEGYEGDSFFSRPRFVGVHHLPGLFWANIFGPEYVEMWGRDFLRAAPCNRIEGLSDDGVILYLSDSPLEAGEAWYPEKKAKLFDYLGHQAFDGRRIPKFRTAFAWRKKRTARPLRQTGGVLDDVFLVEGPSER